VALLDLCTIRSLSGIGIQAKAYGRLSDRFCTRIAEHGDERVIDVQESGIAETQDRHTDGTGIERGRESTFALPEALFCLMSLDGNARQMGRAIDEAQVRAWTSQLVVENGECAEDAAILREERRGPDRGDA
jgi:hypothetical protein